MSDALTAVQQHASSVDLVFSNDERVYNLMYAKAQEVYNQEGGTYELATFIEQLYNETVEFFIDELPKGTSQDLFREVMYGWGIEPYMAIARVYIDELKLYNAQKVG
jgi:hypothetical protein